MKYDSLPYHTFEIGCDGQLIHKWREILEPAGGVPFKPTFWGKKTVLRHLLNPFLKDFSENQSPRVVYTEIAEEAGVSVEEGRKALHDLIDAGIPAMWLYPETDLICSIAPFSNLPTQYRISVDGVQKWFGQ
jgi:hypothetical protein